jgi:hypothetical protein
VKHRIGHVPNDRAHRIALHDQEVSQDGEGQILSAVSLTARPPGPAGRWLIERLRRDVPADGRAE